MGSIGKCEEALEKNSIADCESGIAYASEAIERFKDDAKLYLLRAKLLFKLLVISKPPGKVEKHIKNCLGDCEQAIAIIEQGVMKGDSTTAKIEALKLGYLCCAKLMNSQRKREEFARRLKEFGIEMPANTDQIRNKLLRLYQGGQHGSSISHIYKLQGMLFPKASFIDPPLLEDVIRCYKERQNVCRNCYYNDMILSRGYNAKGECTTCHWEFKNLLVIPKSPMTVNYYTSDMIAIPAWPKSKPNDLPFESCAKSTDKSLNHKRCLIMSRNSAVWYAHTVEELVIWTVEREYNCSFEEYIRDREPVHSATVVAAATMPYQNIYPLQQAATLYYPPSVITCQAGVTPSFNVPAGYMEQLLPTTVSSYSSGFPVSYHIPVCHPTTLYSAPVTVTQFQTESVVQQLDNLTFSSPPISPVVVDDNQQPVASTTANTEDTVSELRYSLKETSFVSVDKIPAHLLESVSTCYSQKIQACFWCFLTHLPSTRHQLLSMSVAKDVCKKCLRLRTRNEIIPVIPASNLCQPSVYGKFVGIPPTPKHTDRIKVFKYCNKHEKTADHTTCLRLTRRGNAWYPHSVEEMVIWTIEYKQGVLFEDVYKKYCKAELIQPPPPTNTRQHGIYLYCDYCKIHANDPTDLEDHCKRDVHKYAVFADSGRDVLWQFEPPPEDYTCVTTHGVDKVKEWKIRVKRRTRIVEEIPFGLRDQAQAKLDATHNICGVNTKLECSCMTLSASCVLSARSTETIIWTLSIKGNQHHSLRGVRFSEESVFKLTQVFSYSTKNNFPITNNMCCAPDSRPGILLGIVKVYFSAVPNKCDEYNSEILIDVGLQKVLSVPVKLKVVTPQLYKLNKCLQSGKLYLNTKSIFSDTTLETQEMSPSSISLEDKQLVKHFQQQLISSQLYSNDCATLLESDEQTNYYKKMSTLVCLEGDHRQRLVQRISRKEIMAKLTFIRGPPSMKVDLQELGEAEVAECFMLLKYSPSVLLHFCNQKNDKACIWECRKELIEDVLLITLPPSFSIPLQYDGEDFSIDFEFTADLTHLAKCYSATISFERRRLGYLLFPSNPLYHSQKGKGITCGPSLKKLTTDSVQLNSQQVMAVKTILLSSSVLPVVIAGPFGTGKTFLLSCAVEYLIKNCQRSFILVCTLTNSAADVYLENFYNRIPPESANILRLVYALRVPMSIPQHIRERYCLFDSKKKCFCYPSQSEINKYRVIVTTLGLAQQLLKLKLTGHFTHIFIDEAAQVTVPEVMMALSLASNTTKVVLAGDHMQVSPQVYSPLAKEYDLHRSPLEQVYAEYSHTQGSGNQILLTCNYRTHGNILKLPSQFFYRGKLRSSNTIEKHPTISPLVFLESNCNNDDKENYLPEFESYLNTNEAENVVKFLKETLLPQWPDHLWGGKPSIAVLTTEYAQDPRIVFEATYHLIYIKYMNEIVGHVNEISMQQYIAMILLQVVCKLPPQNLDASTIMSTPKLISFQGRFKN